MKYHFSQAELRMAIEHYLNTVMLKTPVKVKSVDPEYKKNLGINYCVHVDVYDDQEHVPKEVKAT